MSKQAVDVFLVWVFVAPLVLAIIWCLFMLAPAAIEEVAKTIADIKSAVENLKEAWRG